MFNHNNNKEPFNHQFNGMYRGEVLDNDDPEQVGRCKIRVFGVYDGIDIEFIPWAIYADPFMGGSSDSGGFFVPDVGNHVWVFFENGEHMYPVYFAGAPAATHFPNEKTEGTYPKNRVYKTKKGNIIEINDSNGQEEIKITHSSGTIFHMKNNGDIEETVIGDVVRNISGNVIDNIEGKYTVNIENNYEIYSNGTVVWNSNSGYMELTDELDINGIIFDTHSHSQQEDGQGSFEFDVDEPKNPII